jgi:hypothetical protein
VKYCISLPKTKKAILNQLIFFTKKYERAFPSQGLIAKKVKCTREHVNKTIREFGEVGIILKTNLPWRSCLYELNPFLYSKKFRKIADKFIKKDIQKAIKFAEKKFTPTSLSSSCIFLNNPAIYLKAKLASTITFVSNVVFQKRKKKMFEIQSEVNEVVKSLKLKLTIEQQQQLSKYSESQLLAAQKIVLTKKNINNPISLFFWLLRNDQNVINAKAATTKPAAIPASYPAPDKLKRLNKALEKAQYIKSLKGPKEDSSAIDSEIKFLINQIDLVEKHQNSNKEGLNLNDNVSERSNTQEDKKDSTVVKFNTSFKSLKEMMISNPDMFEEVYD